MKTKQRKKLGAMGAFVVEHHQITLKEAKTKFEKDKLKEFKDYEKLLRKNAN